MKTLISQPKNRTIQTLVLFLAISFIANMNLMAANKQTADTSGITTISGKIIDKQTHKPINYANVYIVGTSIGTVANADGEFILKVSKDKNNQKIGITHLGYKAFSADVNQLKNDKNTVTLELEIIPLQEIVVKNQDPQTIIKGAIQNISKNYRTTPTMITGFYRETVQQNKKYVSIAEAVLETYKTAYDNSFSNDKVKILIGRKSQDVKKMDTVLFKLQGGPVTPFYLDVVKHPEEILSYEYFQYYDYTLSGQISLDNTNCYVIDFNQKKDVNLALYKGKIYIEMESLAIVGIEFGMSEYGLPQANSMFIKKKPMGMKVEITNVNYLVRYSKTNGYWGLNYVRSELRLKCKWNKRLFKSTYSTMVEMAVTEIDTTNINKFKMKETAKITDVFSEKADSFKDDAFWGDYNVIKPEESIQNAIQKLNKKAKK